MVKREVKIIITATYSATVKDWHYTAHAHWMKQYLSPGEVILEERTLAIHIPDREVLLSGTVASMREGLSKLRAKHEQEQQVVEDQIQIMLALPAPKQPSA